MCRRLVPFKASRCHAGEVTADQGSRSGLRVSECGQGQDSECDQGQDSEWDQGQGSDQDQGQGSACDQAQGLQCEQGQGSVGKNRNNLGPEHRLKSVPMVTFPLGSA